MIKFALPCVFAAMGSAAYADTVTVAADVAPVHSLVAQVMHGVAEPVLIVDPSLDPHNANLRPSDARQLQEADVVFMIGDTMTPWLESSIIKLAPDARLVELIEDAPVRLEFQAEHSDHVEDGHDEVGHDDHDEDHAEHEDHDDEHAEHDDHAKEDHAAHDDHDGHNHDGLDPHAWMDTDNAIAWLNTIAQHLSEMDPDNATAYQDNAAASAAQIEKLAGWIDDTTAATEGASYLAYHDAYNYFATRWGYTSAGSLASNEGSAPSAADVRRAQELIASNAIDCVLTERKFGDNTATTVVLDSPVPLIEVDPLGVDQIVGPDLYIALLTRMATDFSGCARQSG